MTHRVYILQTTVCNQLPINFKLVTSDCQTFLERERRPRYFGSPSEVYTNIILDILKIVALLKSSLVKLARYLANC